MKAIILILLFSISVIFHVSSQEITLTGQVYIHNSQYKTGKIQFVENVLVSSLFAQPVYTDEQGRFELKFIGIEQGANLEINVEKTGLEVVNQREIQNVIIGRLTPLKIYLAPKGQIVQAQTELYDISLTTITAKHDALIAELRKGGEESKAVIKKLEQQLNREITHRFEAEEILNEQLEASKRKLPEFIYNISKVNLDFASEMYRQAYEYFKVGKIEIAIRTIDEAVLDQQILESISQITRLKSDIKYLENSIIFNTEYINQIIESYKLKAKSFSQIRQYEKALEAHQNIIKFQEQILGPIHPDIASSFNELAIIYQKMGNYNEALKHFQITLNIREQSLDKNAPNIASSYNNIGIVYQNLGKYDNALEAQMNALGIQEQTSEIDAFGIAFTYNNLASVYQDLGEFDKALELQQKALVIRIRPSNYIPISFTQSPGNNSSIRLIGCSGIRCKIARSQVYGLTSNRLQVPKKEYIIAMRCAAA